MDGGSQSNRTLEQRLREIEDRLATLNLIASHPPSADTGADYFTRAVYVEDGSMDLGGGKGANGNVTNTNNSITRPSNKRSSTTVASDALIGTPSFRRSTYERNNSPARAGYTLLPM